MMGRFKEALGYVAIKVVLNDWDDRLWDITALGSVRTGYLMVEIELQVRNVQDAAAV